MNQGQAQFYDFLLERIQDQYKEEGTTLLQEGFAKQAEKTFDKEYLQSYNAKLLSLLKPENVGEVREILTKFGRDHVSRSDESN